MQRIAIATRGSWGTRSLYFHATPNRRGFTWRFAWPLFVLLLSPCWSASAQSRNSVGWQSTDSNGRLPTGQRDPRLPAESWQVIMDGETRVGYATTRWRWLTLHDDHAAELEWTQSTHLTLRRFGDASTQQIHLTSVEHPNGTVRRCDAQHVDGDQQTTVSAIRQGDTLRFEIDQAGPIPAMKVDEADTVRGFFALEQSLADQPMRPREIRRLGCLFPLSPVMAQLTLTATEVESTELLQGQARLLRIEGRARLSEKAVLEFTCWQENDGQILKMRVPATHQTTFVCTREFALKAIDPTSLLAHDLGRQTLIRSSDLPTDPHHTARMEYVIRAGKGSLRDVFPVTDVQSVRDLADNEVVLTLQRIDSASHAAPRRAAVTVPVDAPAEEDLKANHWIDSDDHLIERMSHEIAIGETAPMVVARALSAHVREWIEDKDFGRTLDTATLVAQSRRGDCTEHAMLLTALCRARQIPARVAFGLVYSGHHRSFAFHAWTEVWVDGRWMGLDATRDSDLVACGHIKVGDAHLGDTTAAAALLPLAVLQGKDITIDAGGRRTDEGVGVP